MFGLDNLRLESCQLCESSEQSLELTVEDEKMEWDEDGWLK